MSILRITGFLRKKLGWCPITGNTQDSADIRQDLSMNHEEKTGPVRRRAALFIWLTWTVVGLSYLIAFIALPSLPEVVPIHWNLYGEPDGFSDPFTSAFGLPVIITLITLLLMVLPGFEKIKTPLDNARDIYQVVVLSMICMLMGIEIVVLLSSSGMNLDVGVIISILIGLFFIVIGSLMPYIGRNTTIGIRLPWTLRDDDVWKKTHAFGGPVFVIGGIIIVAGSPFSGKWAMVLLLGVLAVIITAVTFYSYQIAQTESSHSGQ